jgi:hypothetical protein
MSARAGLGLFRGIEAVEKPAVANRASAGLAAAQTSARRVARRPVSAAGQFVLGGALGAGVAAQEPGALVADDRFDG